MRLQKERKKVGEGKKAKDIAAESVNCSLRGVKGVETKIALLRLPGLGVGGEAAGHPSVGKPEPRRGVPQVRCPPQELCSIL